MIHDMDLDSTAPDKAVLQHPSCIWRRGVIDVDEGPLPSGGRRLLLHDKSRDGEKRPGIKMIEATSRREMMEILSKIHTHVPTLHGRYGSGSGYEII